MKMPLNQSVKKRSLTILIFILSFLPTFTQAQERVITGTVTDQHGRPVSGVTVKQEDFKFATITKNDGSFEFTITGNAPVLNFFKRGYSSEEVKAGNGTLSVILVQQVETVFNLGDSVANFGFYRWSRDNTSFSYSAKEPEYYERSEITTADFLETIPGLIIDQYSGLPGADFSAGIRGIESLFSTQPLYVVDGVVQNSGINQPESFSTGNSLFSVNVKDIESVTVLKSAAATTFYGSRGANGVVLIETKRGKNEPLRISYHGQAGAHFRRYQPEMLPADDYFGLINESLDAAGREMISFVGAFEDKNWLDRSLQTGVVTDHTLSLSGGGKRSHYYLSGNYIFDRGTVQGTGLHAGRLRFNHSTEVAQWLQLGVNFGYGQWGHRNRIQASSPALEDPLIYAAIYPPVGGNDISRFPELYNRYGALSPEEFLDNQIAENTGSQFAGGISLNIRFTDNLSFNTRATGDYNDVGKEWSRYVMENHFIYSGNTLHKSLTGSQYNWHIYNYLDFEKLYGNSHWVFLLGSDQNYIKSETDAGYLFNGQTGPAELFYEGRNSVRINALFARLGYGWDNKLDISASFRREQMLRQEGTVMFGLFPSFSGGYWFFKNDALNRRIFSGAKLKLGWGIPGAGNFRFLNYNVTSGNPETFSPVKKYTEEVSLQSSHPNALWEVTEEWNVGVLTEWFGADLSVSLDYFDRLRENVAFRLMSPDELYEYTWLHSARVANSGVELHTDYRKDFGNMGITGGLYMQFSQSTVLELGEGLSDQISTGFLKNTEVPVTVLKTGEEPGAFWGYRKIGMFQSDQEVRFANAIDGNPETFYQDEHTSAGDIKFEDLNRDGKIDERDMTTIGSPHPDMVYQFTTGLIYGNFDFSLFIDGMHGNKVFDLNEIWSNATGGWGNRVAEMENRWSPDNEGGVLPRVHISDPNVNSRPHSGMIKNAGYFRINKIDLGYKFPGWRNEKHTRVYLSFQNLATIAAFQGGTGFSTSVFTGPGVKYGLFPASATLLAGVQLGI